MNTQRNVNAQITTENNSEMLKNDQIPRPVIADLAETGHPKTQEESICEIKDMLNSHVFSRFWLLSSTSLSSGMAVLSQILPYWMKDETAAIYSFAGISALYPLVSELTNNIKSYNQRKTVDALILHMQDERKNFPSIERQSRNYERAQSQMENVINYGTFYVYRKWDLIPGYTALALSLVPIFSTPLPALISLGSTAVSCAGSYLVAKYTSRLRRQANIEAINTVNKNDEKIRANIRQTSRDVSNNQNMDMYNERRTEIKESQKKSYKSLFNLHKKNAKYWLMYGVGTLATATAAILTPLMLGINPSQFSLGTISGILITSGIITGAVSKIVNVFSDCKQSIALASKAYQRFVHIKNYGVQFGKENVSSKASVFRLNNIAYTNRIPEKEEEAAQENLKKELDQKIKENPYLKETYMKDYSQRLESIPRQGNRRDKGLFSAENDFEIGAGITVIGGASNAGKSRLIGLLMHEDDPSRGDVCIGHYENGQFISQNLKELSQYALLDVVAHISQNVSLSGNYTVKEFILGKAPEDITDKAYQEKLKKYEEIKEVLRIGDGKDGRNVIDENRSLDPSANTFSGGEAKRIALARALVKDQPILILDEVTAGIDPGTSKALIDYLNKIKETKTIIVITHIIDDLSNLSTDQALDLDKPDPNQPAQLTRWNLADPKIKAEYIEYVKSRGPQKSDSDQTITADQRNLTHTSLLDDLKKGENRTQIKPLTPSPETVKKSRSHRTQNLLRDIEEFSAPLSNNGEKPSVSSILRSRNTHHSSR